MPFIHRNILTSIFEGSGSTTSKHVQIDHHWYDLELILGIISAFDPSTQAKIGMCTPCNAIYPSRSDSFEGAIQNLNRAYKLNHLGRGIGDYEVTNNSSHRITVLCNNPYPLDFNRGLIQGIANKFNACVELNTLCDSGGGKFEVILVPNRLQLDGVFHRRDTTETGTLVEIDKLLRIES